MVEKLKKPQAHEINATSLCVLPACRSNSPQLQIKFFTRELKLPLLTSPFQLLTFPVPPGKVQIDGPSHVSVNERDQDHVTVSCSSSPSNPAAKLTFVLKDENDEVIEVDPENFAERSDLVSGVESEAKYGERVKGWISTAKVTLKVSEIGRGQGHSGFKVKCLGENPVSQEPMMDLITIAKDCKDKKAIKKGR